MRERPPPPDCSYGYVSNHYARLHHQTIVTKPDNRPDLFENRTALLTNASAKVESVRDCNERVCSAVVVDSGTKEKSFRGDALASNYGARLRI